MAASIPIDSRVKTSNVCLVPPAVTNLQVVRVTMTAARISWEAPNLEGCDSFKGYQIFLSKFEDDEKVKILLSLLSDDVEHECVNECVVTLSSLSASTTYQIDVCAVTSKGKGPKATINLVTASAGKLRDRRGNESDRSLFSFEVMHFLHHQRFRSSVAERSMSNGKHPKRFPAV